MGEEGGPVLAAGDVPEHQEAIDMPCGERLAVGEKATIRSGPGPLKVAPSRPVAASQTLIVLSPLLAASQRLSGEKATL